MGKQRDYCERMDCTIRKRNCRNCDCFDCCDEWEISTTGKIVRNVIAVAIGVAILNAIKNR